MQTRDQKYAHAIYQQVEKIQAWPEKKRNQYGGLAHKLPVLIRTSGLVQALAFIDTKAKDKAKDNQAHRQILDDVAETLGKTDRKQLLERAREAELTEYMLLTQQALAALLWYKRFAQSLLDVHDAQSVEDQ